MSIGPAIIELPIEDIDRPDVQEAGRHAILEHNTKENDNLTFIHVVNGLAPSIVTGVSTYYILVIKAKTAHGIVWSYVVNVTKYFTIPSPSYHLNSFRDVIPYK